MSPSHSPSSSARRPPGRGGLRTALAWSLGTLLSVAAVRAQAGFDLGHPNAAAAQMERQLLNGMLQKKMPGQPASAIDRARQEFIDHLHQSSPIMAENFETGRMGEDDLASRLEVFLGDHPEYTGRPVRAAAVDPRRQLAELLGREPDLAKTEAERRALAERFIARLGELSGTARDRLLAGRMPFDELRPRVTVFVSNLRAEAARAAADPAVAAAIPIVEAYVKANFGSATDRPDSFCFRGVVESGTASREFVTFKARPNLLRIHVVKDGLVIAVLGYDGANPWIEVPGKPPRRAIGHEADLLAVDSAQFEDPLIGYREHGIAVRLEDRPSAGLLHLRIRQANGAEMVATIDPTTYEEISLRKQAPGGAWSETRFKDYRKVGAIKFPFLVEQWNDGALRSTTRVSEVKFDPGMLTRFFAPPASLAFDFMDYMGGLAAWDAQSKAAPKKGGAP